MPFLANLKVILPVVGLDLLKPLQDFDDHTVKTRDALTRMKRTYTLKLFAGGAEAKELFTSLGKELSALTR